VGIEVGESGWRWCRYRGSRLSEPEALILEVETPSPSTITYKTTMHSSLSSSPLSFNFRTPNSSCQSYSIQSLCITTPRLYDNVCKALKIAQFDLACCATPELLPLQVLKRMSMKKCKETPASPLTYPAVLNQSIIHNLLGKTRTSTAPRLRLR
jgi:hypothetical protein